MFAAALTAAAATAACLRVSAGDAAPSLPPSLPPLPPVHAGYFLRLQHVGHLHEDAPSLSRRNHSSGNAAHAARRVASRSVYSSMHGGTAGNLDVDLRSDLDGARRIVSPLQHNDPPLRDRSAARRGDANDVSSGHRGGVLPGASLFSRTQSHTPWSKDAVASSTEIQKEEVNISCPPLEILDFLSVNRSNISHVEELELEWPCEVRLYWIQINGLIVLVKFLFKYGAIALIFTGLIVNVYSLIVLNSPPINKYNISVYLRALAISDMGALIFNVSVGVIRARSTAVNDFYVHYNWTCALDKVLLTVFSYYSSWIVVTFTFERLLMIKNPFKIHTWHNEKPAKITVIILAAATLGVALLRSMTRGFEQDNLYGYKSCGVSDYPEVSINVIPFVLFTTILPTILISVANVCLLIHVRRSDQDHSNLNALHSEDSTNAIKVTRMLIIVSIVYLVLYMPLGVIGTVELFYRNEIREVPTESGPALDGYIKWKQQMLLLRWIRGLALFLYFLSYINNFFLYCLSGDIFRQTVKVCLQHAFPRCFRKYCSCLKNKPIPTLTRKSRNKRTGKFFPMSERNTSQSNLFSENSHSNGILPDTEKKIAHDSPLPIIEEK